MLSMFSKMRKRIYSVALLIVFAVIAAAAVFARGVLRNYVLGHNTTPANQAEKSLPSAPDKRLPTRLLALKIDGFEPAEVIWDKKEFLLVIDNHTAITDLTFQLNREHGARVKEIKMKMRRQRTAGVFDLSPGQYVLTEVNHPDWVCRITVN